MVQCTFFQHYCLVLGWILDMSSPILGLAQSRNPEILPFICQDHDKENSSRTERDPVSRLHSCTQYT